MRIFRALICGSAMCGAMFLGSYAKGDPPIRDRIPRLTDPVIYDTEFGTYTDQQPFVASVNWDHPLIKGAQPAVEAVSRSTMSYGDHLKIYDLDAENDWSGQKGLYHYWDTKHDADPDERQRNLDEIDAKVARANYENFVRTLLGECRDYPYMVKRKLEVLALHTTVNLAGPQGDVADAENPFDSLTGDGYSRLRWIESELYEARLAKLNPGGQSRFNYAWNEVGHVCNRVDNSVKPFTVAEVRYIFSEWLRGDPKPFNLDQFEAGLQKFIAENCDPDPNGPDLGYMINHRGHKNFKANWFECNGFIWASRDAARIAEAQLRNSSLTFDPSYYQRPFAFRREKTKELLGAYLFYPSEHHEHMRKASESGGGPHLYVDNEDANGDGVADYRLFADVQGSGDIGLGSQALHRDKVAAGAVTRETVKSFSAYRMRRWKDWGFNSTFTVNAATRADFAADGVFDASDSDEEATFKLRMARVNQALDRHTNWGPTHMFSVKASQIAKRYAVRGAHSPIVAMSYEISKSHSFAVGNYPSTHPKDQNKTKFMFIVKLPTKSYYDERDMRAGRRIFWDEAYLNETSLSNDYYHERALDKFGWIPADDISTAAYLAEADGEASYYPPYTSSSVWGSGSGIIEAFESSTDADD